MLEKQIVRVGADGTSLKSWQALILLVLDIPPKI
jgi:hypothetical protein